jgi:DNA-binding response OmpR family regulator
VSSLTQAGFAVDWSQTLGEGRELVAANSYDLILLDLRLPDGNGLDLLRTLRRSRNNVPVIILSAADTVDDRVIGLTEGADDYIVKPFASSELVARIRVALRRPGAPLGINLICGNVVFNTVSSTVSIGDRSVLVPRRELAVLEVLMRANGRVVSKAALEEAAYAMDNDRQSNVVESQVSRLRRRLESAGAQISIRVARGIGYRIEEMREQDAESDEISSVS